MENYFSYYAFNQDKFNEKVREIEEIAVKKQKLLNKIR